MTTTESMAWFLFMAVAIFAILAVGTLFAADLMPRPHTRRRDQQHSSDGRPETTEVPAGMQPSGSQRSPAPSSALLDPDMKHGSAA